MNPIPKNKLVSQETIEDICGCQGKAGDNGHCILRDLVALMGLNDKLLEQYKCIEIFKFERRIGGEDNGWAEASKLWVDEGYAKRFSEVYKDGMKARKIYNAIFER